MCRVIEEMRIQEREEGRQEVQQEVAARMLRAGKYAPEEICALCGLSSDELKALQAEATA